MKKQQDQQEVGGFLGWVERVGNALPHPALIFVILSAILLVVAHFMAMRGVSVDFISRTGEAEVVSVVSLFNAEGIRYIFNNVVSNFGSYSPMAVVLVAMLGVGVAENSGMLNALFKNMLSNVNPRLLTAVVVFVGVISNIASDAGYVVVIPLGGIIFANAGRHPIAGIAAAFAGVSGGFSANLVVGPTDALLVGITNDALKAANIVGHDVLMAGNWYFLVASTFFLVIVGTLVTELIVVPNLGEYTGGHQEDDMPLTEAEKRGLKKAGIVFLVYAAIILFLAVGPGKILQEYNELTEKIDLNTFLGNALVFVVMMGFTFPGWAYGKEVGTINDFNDLIGAMTESMSSMGAFLVLAFFASQFINLFGATNMGTVISVSGAQWLESVGLTGIPLIVVFIFLCAFLNLFMGSASAKWAIMAPIFAPMLLEMNISPALTQLAYRIGDSTTNIITPLMTYFAMVVVFINQYDEERGLGTLISTMIPYSMAFLFFWTGLLVVWMLLGLPLGPDTPLYASMLF